MWTIIIIFIIGIVVMCFLAYIIGSWQNNKWKESVGIDPKDPNGFEKYLQEQRWKIQESNDKEILNSNQNIKKTMESAFYPISIVWELIESDQRADTFFNAKLCLDSLTSDLFLKMFYALKNNDERQIKDAIYKERPYFTHSTLIKMGLYIFKTNNQIRILEYIIESNNSPLLTAKAQEILIHEASK